LRFGSPRSALRLATPVSPTGKVASADATQANQEGENLMSNLFDMRCPKCRDEERIDILAEVWIRVCQDGTDADASGCGDHLFTPKSTACCGACGHWETVGAFTPDMAKA
jgi:hypothetical protein